MADLTPTSLGTASSTVIGANVTLTGVTLPANSIVFAAIATRRNTSAGSAPTITDNVGLTWIELIDQIYDSGSNPRLRMRIFMALIYTTPIVANITANGVNAVATGLSLLSMPSDALVNVKAGYGVSSTGDPSVILETLQPNSALLGWYYCAGGNAVTPPPGFTELQEFLTSGTQSPFEVCYNLAPSSQVVTWTTQNVQALGIAAEVIYSEGGSTPSPVAVVVNNTFNGQISEQPLLAAKVSVTPANANSTSLAGTPSLVSKGTTNPLTISHQHTTTSPAIGVRATVTSANSNHSHLSTSPLSSAFVTASVNGSLSGHISTQPLSMPRGVVIPTEKVHPHNVGSPIVQGVATPQVLVNSTIHVQTVGSPSQVVRVATVPTSANHSHSSDSAVLLVEALVAAANTYHLQDVEAPIIAYHSASFPEDVFEFAADIEPVVIYREATLLPMPPQNRVFTSERISTVAKVSKFRRVFER